MGCRGRTHTLPVPSVPTPQRRAAASPRPVPAARKQPSPSPPPRSAGHAPACAANGQWEPERPGRRGEGRGPAGRAPPPPQLTVPAVRRRSPRRTAQPGSAVPPGPLLPARGTLTRSAAGPGPCAGRQRRDPPGAGGGWGGGGGCGEMQAGKRSRRPGGAQQRGRSPRERGPLRAEGGVPPALPSPGPHVGGVRGSPPPFVSVRETARGGGAPTAERM